MPTVQRPPENPDSRANAISSRLIEGLRARVMGDRISDEPLEFLAEGVALGDVEYALHRLGSSLTSWFRIGSQPGGYPCLTDDDGPVPIDLWDFSVIPTEADSYPPDYKLLDYRILERQLYLYRRAGMDRLTLNGVLDAVQYRLSKFLQTRVENEGGSEPERGHSGNPAGGGSEEALAVALDVALQDDWEVESLAASETEYEATAEDQIHNATRHVFRGRSLGAAVAGFTGTPTLYQATIHTSEQGLRIHQSPAYFINWSLVFGSPTPSVTGWLLPGRYKFGAMSPSGKFRFDKSNFDIPPLSSFDLVLNQ